MACMFACLVPEWYITVLLLALLTRWYFKRTHQYWKDRGVPCIKPVLFFGSIKDRILFRESFHEFQQQIYEKLHGYKFGGYYEGRRPVLMVRDPELIKHMLVRDFDHFMDRPVMRLRNQTNIANMLLMLKGSHWKGVRALITPTFSSGKLKAMEELVCQCGEQLGTYLQDHGAGEQLEMKEFFGRFTLDVIATCAFGVQCDSLKDPEAQFVRIAARFNDTGILNRIAIFAMILLAPQMGRFLPLSFLNKESVKFLVEVLRTTMKYRRAHPEEKRNDFLQLMMDAAEAEEGDSKKKVLTEQIIVSQALLFLLAGFETSSTLLTFASYEMALNPDLQEELRNEIHQVLEKHEGRCSYEALQDMVYLERVLLETLRKHPPVARVDRVVTQEYTIPGTEVKLEVDQAVFIPTVGLHHDPQFYPDPERFDPDRFLPEAKAKRSPHVFLPFGAGPRNCIGLRFALMSTKVAMVYLFKDFMLSPSPKTEIPYKFNRFSMFLKAESGIWLNVQKIKSEEQETAK